MCLFCQFRPSVQLTVSAKLVARNRCPCLQSSTPTVNLLAAVRATSCLALVATRRQRRATSLDFLTSCWASHWPRREGLTSADTVWHALHLAQVCFPSCLLNGRKDSRNHATDFSVADLPARLFLSLCGCVYACGMRATCLSTLRSKLASVVVCAGSQTWR